MWRTSHHTTVKKRWRHKSRGRLFPKGGGPDTARPTDTPTSNPPSTLSGPMTRARAKALHDKVNSLLVTLDLGTSMDGMLLTVDTLCVIRYLPHEQDDEMMSRQEEQDEVVTPGPVLPLEDSGTTTGS